MTRDYAKTKRTSSKRGKSRAKTNKRKARPGLWVLTVFVVAVFAASLYYLHQQGGTKKIVKAVNKTLKTTTKKKTVQTTKKENKPRFEFYSMLKNGQQQENATNEGKNSATLSQEFFLQVASFKEYKDADSVKARLLLMGYNVQIKTVDTTKGQWNRVYVGPYVNPDSAKKAQNSLAKIKIDSILLKS